MLFLFPNKLVKNCKDEEALLIYSAYKSTIECIKRYSIFLSFTLLLKVVGLASLPKVVRLVLPPKVVRFASSPKIVGLASSKVKTKV